MLAPVDEPRTYFLQYMYAALLYRFQLSNKFIYETHALGY